MNHTLLELAVIGPELVLSAGICVSLLLGLWGTTAQREARGFYASLLTLVIALVLVLTSTSVPQLLFSGLYVVDWFALLLKAASALTAIAVLMYARRSLQMAGLARAELYALVLFVVLGGWVLMSAADLLMVYLGVELMALASCALVAWDRDNVKSTEAAFKLFVLSAVASGFLLYGISLVYANTGSLQLHQIHRLMSIVNMGERPVALMALVFLVVGLGFKLGLVPFHVWLPDVYEGSRTPVTLVLATLPKLAAFAFAVRVLVVGMDTHILEWRYLIHFLGLLSVALGNLFALLQTNIKRMLAYSAIANMGLAFMGFSSGHISGPLTALVYVPTYVLMSLGVLGVMNLIQRQGQCLDTLDDVQGLSRTHPFYALLLLCLMASMAGLPPFIGFFSKLLVLQSLYAGSPLWQLVYVLMFSVVGAFYYLRVIKLMYFDEPLNPERAQVSWPASVVLSINVAVVVFGFAVIPWLLKGATEALRDLI